MDAQFWHQRWQEQQIGFHRTDVNPLLTTFFPILCVEPPARIFIPLCGKTLDIHWLLAQGYQVCGAELSEQAIQQLFQELGLNPKIEENENFKHYFTDNIDIFVGDIFNLTTKIVGHIDAVYDRAALVALPQSMRTVYAKQVMTLSQHAPQLLIQYEYDQDLMAGPPFSVSESEMMQLYANFSSKHLLKSEKLQNDKLNEHMGDQADILEKVWVLKNN